MRLVNVAPHHGRAVVVVGVDVVVVGVHPCQDGAPGGAAHGGGYERAVHRHTFVDQHSP